MPNNYYMASKVIIPPWYYESVVKNAADTKSIIVVDNESAIPKVKEASKKTGVPLVDEPITIDQYVEMMNNKDKQEDIIA